jgi:hypothetical protein
MIHLDSIHGETAFVVEQSVLRKFRLYTALGLQRGGSCFKYLSLKVNQTDLLNYIQKTKTKISQRVKATKNGLSNFKKKSHLILSFGKVLRVMLLVHIK